MSESILECTDVSVLYNRNAVGIEGVSFTVGRGEIVALVGPNGAGKTTTLRAVSGFLRAEAGALSRGKVVYNGEDITGKPIFQNARKGIALVPEDNKIFRSLTVEENLAVAPRTDSSQADSLAFALELFPVLKDKWKMHAGYLSGGQRQMLAVSMALTNAPKILLADELSQGIAPVLVTEILKAVARINEEMGVSVLLVEQNVRSALTISHRVNVIEGGKLVWRGTTDEARS
ncbi:MAG: ABC transporter ATP-binding protein, partial [Leucobacter sp.]|nr:ABC transporter ATP-binding protein [Leucobacter sp.]